MTQSDDRSSEHDDDMLPEYGLSQLGRGVRGKHAEAMRQGYSVTVHHDDGTSTTHYVPPQDFISTVEASLADSEAGRVTTVEAVQQQFVLPE